MAGEWFSVRLGDLTELHTEQVNPADQPDQLFQHFSIPAFDATREPTVELGSAIGSHKFTVPRDAILVSKLNPRFPRVWEPAVSMDYPAVASTEFLALRPKRAMDRRFIRYLLLSPLVSSEMRARTTGTSGSHQRVRPQDVLQIEVTVPEDIAEQRAIAYILGTLDDKIELNRRMNETLEAIARTIFKSWFVDFDPVRAKAEGRRPGMDAETAALFPDAFEDSSLGEIPKGWQVVTLSDVAENPRRIVQPSGIGTGTPYIALEHMPRHSIALGDWGSAENVASAKFQYRRYDFLFGKLRPYFHKAGVATTDGVCSTDILVIAPKRPDFFGFVLGHVFSDALVQYADAVSTGTKMPRVGWKDLARYSIALPSPTVARRFDAVVRPMVDRISASILESRDLAVLRDTLLPKLVSGEIRVKDAERIVERVV
jgi:type I restriction enzyme S subunit